MNVLRHVWLLQSVKSRRGMSICKSSFHQAFHSLAMGKKLFTFMTERWTCNKNASHTVQQGGRIAFEE